MTPYLIGSLILVALPQSPASPADEKTVNLDYATAVAPILKRYCVGCHNDKDREGNFSAESYASLLQGATDGPAFLVGDDESSRMIRLMTGAAEPRMPPNGHPRPSESEIGVIRAWIAEGAKGPEGVQPEPLSLIVPQIDSQSSVRPVTALALRPDGRWLAVGRFTTVELWSINGDGSRTGETPERILTTLPGKVTALHFTPDGTRLVIACGVAGLGGVAAIWNADDGTFLREFRGHRDLIYDAELSPDGLILATCSYDGSIRLWNAELGEPIRQLNGHNGAVYDVAFSPDGRFLVSGSADDTCKVWRVADGERLDTLGQPLKEVLCCTFSPDGRSIVAGGADNNIRVWSFIASDQPRINTMVLARFAHEGPIATLAFTPDGSRLISSGEDRSVKVWDTSDYSELEVWNDQPDVVMALAVAGNGREVHLGRMDGSLGRFPIPPTRRRSADPNQVEASSSPPNETNRPVQLVTEREPNHTLANSQEVSLPAQIRGLIAGSAGQEADSDLYRFSGQVGQQVVIEVDAARSGSKLDSFVEVLDNLGNRVERVRLQAVRDSYFTFRGKDDVTVDDFRLFNWQEMRLNEYLYANGEVVKLWLYPRGPDSGFMVYPGQGKRWGFFDTTPLAHALGEPCYIVEAHPPGTVLTPNGLPVFPLHFENDDASDRGLGKDSRLFFTVPSDGEYIVKIKDVRGFEGSDFGYTLTIRPRRPDFRVTLHGTNPTVNPDGAREIKVVAERIDGFEGPIRVDIDGLPPGFSVTSPIVIEAGQIEALGVLWATSHAPGPTPENSKRSQVTATASIDGLEVAHPVNALGEIKLGEPSRLRVAIVPAEGGAQPLQPTPNSPLEFKVAPGQTIMLKVVVDRNGFTGPVAFGKEGAGRNLPFGTYVDNLGLNGLLITERQTERAFFVTADPSIPEQRRLFHLTTSADGGRSSLPVWLQFQR